MIANFSDLLEISVSQDQPQRLLMLFANADGGSSNPKKQRKQQHGAISPVMCVLLLTWPDSQIQCKP